ncbi:uncharacterized protein LTR77_008557 [Saxophila tyrrhenica]|uniref:MARVEL domain-containing protein n=1 Tax=Saxophila tyrrhenica TaxID=1690608 RepID=A0AAV9P1P3_9PEZI|nr:hypothetical protein LTR77_008557 [Saxophila tyrrhenica]
MRIPQTYYQKIKAGLHFAQGFLIFIAGCLALAVLTQEGEHGGQVGYYFAQLQCFLTLPGLIYQIMVPMWTRAWRFANVYAYAAIDLLYTLLWFAAFVAVAVWQSEGLKEGSKNKDGDKDGKGSCEQFGYGSATKCQVTKAAVGFGVVIWLLFIATSVISIQGVLQFRRTGIMPNGNSTKHGQAERFEDPSKDVWSTNTDELDDSHPSHRPSVSPGDDDARRAYSQLSTADEDEQGLLQRPSIQADDPFADTHSMTEHGMHPGRAFSYQSGSNLSITAPPSYHEQTAGAVGIPSPSGYVAPSALSPSDYEQTPGGRVNFPQANYGANFR